MNPLLKFLPLPKLPCVFLCCLLMTGLGPAPAAATAANDKILGIYIHQHWSYQHPYAARTWTLEDWESYINGIHQLGYNTLLIWPMLETIPSPLTESDSAHVEKIASVIQLAKEKFDMSVYLTLCPNIVPDPEEALRYRFEERPFFLVEKLVDPRDAAAMQEMLDWREQLLRPLIGADGVFIIDSDPGGWPGSTNEDFVNLIGAHRDMLDRLRPGMEIHYWTHVGWENYGRFYAHGTMSGAAQQEEIREVIQLLADRAYEPWGIVGSRYENDIAEIADSVGEGKRVLTFKYGAIEREPAYPFTIFHSERALAGGRDVGAKGILGNAQSHGIQLPNTFLFARLARGLDTERSDYVAFANDLVEGHGEIIVDSWEALQGRDTERMRDLAEKLRSIHSGIVTGGRLAGLTFDNPSRFLSDLFLQLEAMASMYDFMDTVDNELENPEKVKLRLADLIPSFEAWQKAHGYSGNPRSGNLVPGPMEQLMAALQKLDVASLNRHLDSLHVKNAPGETGPERVKNHFRNMESYTARLIEEMKRALAELQQGRNP